jgi:hypothetical protein
MRIRDSSAVQRWATGWIIGVRFPAGVGNSSLHHRVQTDYGARATSYPMGNRGSYPGAKPVGTWRSPLTSIYCRSVECVELTSTPPPPPSRRGYQLKQSDFAYDTDLFQIPGVFFTCCFANSLKNEKRRNKLRKETLPQRNSWYYGCRQDPVRKGAPNQRREITFIQRVDKSV